MLHQAIPPMMPFADSRRDRLANGNRLTKTEGASSTSYTYTAGTNRLATATGSEPATYGYDSNGNTTGDGTHTYQYSQRDRLATVDSGTTAAYSYDGDGRRVKKAAGGITTLYFYDSDGKLLEEYVPATGTGKDYVWFPGTYEPLARIDFSMADNDNGNVLRVTKSSPNVHLDWSLDGTSGPFVVKRSQSFTFSNSIYLGPAQTAKTYNDTVLGNATSYAYEAFRRTLTDTLYFYHADHLGTPIAMTNSVGSLVWRAEHTPFGGIYALTVGTIANNLRFPGQYYDGETGLAQSWFRDYGHNTGRYWESDPIALQLLRSSIVTLCSPYCYANESPLQLTDRWGLKGCCKKCPSGRWIYASGPASFTFVIVVGGMHSHGVLKCYDDPWGTQVPVSIDCGGGGLMAAISWDAFGQSVGSALTGITDSCSIPDSSKGTAIAFSVPFFGGSRPLHGGPFSLTFSPGLGAGAGVFSCTTTRRD